MVLLPNKLTEGQHGALRKIILMVHAVKQTVSAAIWF
jgi:hypothetical protein